MNLVMRCENVGQILFSLSSVAKLRVKWRNFKMDENLLCDTYLPKNGVASISSVD